MNTPARAVQIQQYHQTYCRLTGQSLTLRFDRERLWYEFIRAGFTLEDLTRVIRYLQKEIRHTRRNIGALKLSNLLQPDRFEEDLNISRVRLHPEPSRPNPPAASGPSCSTAELEEKRLQALKQLGEFKEKLRTGRL